ncbi:DUF5683 domain-containing protein [Niallia taxi]|uniref:DUF5683 domain-containing protein n=1 Tax=Niallia taxi TaxID=2499688 RepID=A0A3S3SI05_9BACI|nr:DUF5683 domain-containing protein [Niallia taxi]RVT59054.1 hypothetical protein EM808_19915 [Niallia taxi]
MNNSYKSPWASLLWSFVIPGFGQFYNGQFLIGIVLVALEVLINSCSNLNMSIYHTFHGELQKAHEVVNYNWGLFYPSLWGYGMWQAYNQALTINNNLREKGIKEPCKRAVFTGLLYGFVAGMVLGLFFQFILVSPVYTGLTIGIIGAVIGHLVEKLIFKGKQKKESNTLG